MNNRLTPLSLKPARYGVAEIVVDPPSAIDRLRGAMDGQPLHRQTYTRLLINGTTVMTDAEFETCTNMAVVQQARGRVLIAGLGLGYIIRPMISNTAVESVLILEKEADVISLIKPTITSQKLSIMKADAKCWNANGEKFETIYLDIWSYINSDVRREAGRLQRRFRRWLAPDGWISTWPAQCPRGRY